MALLPSSSIRQEESDGTLGIVPVEDLPQVPTRIVSMRRRDAGPPSGAVKAFLDLLSQGARSQG